LRREGVDWKMGDGGGGRNGGTGEKGTEKNSAWLSREMMDGDDDDG
jgi:hypothetical protein